MCNMEYQKRLRTKMGQVINCLKRFAGNDAIMMLQGVPMWDQMDGYVHGGFTYRTNEGSEAGILVPLSMDAAVTDDGGGRDWYGITLGRTSFISMHAIDIHRQAHSDNRYEHMRAEVDEYITRNKTVGRNKLVLGIDLNTTLVPGWEGLTGSNLLPLQDWHNKISQDKAMELM